MRIKTPISLRQNIKLNNLWDNNEEEKYTAVQRNSSEREGHNINTRYLKEIMMQYFGYTTQGLCEKVYYYYYISSSFNLG